MNHHRSLLPIWVFVLLPGISAQDVAPGAAASTLTRTSVEIAGGTVTASYTPMRLGTRSLESTQDRGTVWSMSQHEAAVFETSVALLSGKALIPPGRYRMSTWYQKRGVWHLLIFRKGKNYRSGTEYIDVPIRIDALDQPIETLEIVVRDVGGIVELALRGGRSHLRTLLVPLRVDRQKTKVLGHPATYEFYSWPATPELQTRIRAFEPIQFGRMRHDMPFGVVYDLSCRSDGKGVFINATSNTLRENRELLVATVRQLQASGEKPDLVRREGLLRQAIGVQEAMLTNVMIAADTITMRPRIPRLIAKPYGKIAPSKARPEADPLSDPKLDPKAKTDPKAKGQAVKKFTGPIRGFVLGFGFRRVEFPIHDENYKRLSWK